ncbi:MAG: phosphopentomutase [Rhodobacteraceae bacterium]|nr:phosphopentomutase [Paracoccaceae bacterium]
MARAFLFVLDSVGIGGAPDAADYGDAGSNTVGHIAQACAAGKGDRDGLRHGPLTLPNLVAMGLGAACTDATGQIPNGLEGTPRNPWAVGVETSNGKDTPSGHWEIAGVPVTFDWTVFPDENPSLPAWLIRDLTKQAGLSGLLGCRHYSGTAVIDDFGAEHMRTGALICYTSADSVLQLAAHEESFGLERLYAVCEIARKLVDPMSLGRVIARPFVGDASSGFTRTGNRRDYAMPPPGVTVLDRLTDAGRHIITMGKIGDIFAHRGVGDVRKAFGNMPLMDKTLTAMDDLANGGFLFANFVDFDSEFGHRRDVPGYANALEEFDARMPQVFAKLRRDDLLILTADHGNDPTWRGSDHTREQVPVLIRLGDAAPASLGKRVMSDMGATVAAHLGVARGEVGNSFLDMIGSKT